MPGEKILTDKEKSRIAHLEAENWNGFGKGLVDGGRDLSLTSTEHSSRFFRTMGLLYDVIASQETENESLPSTTD